MYEGRLPFIFIHLRLETKKECCTCRNSANYLVDITNIDTTDYRDISVQPSVLILVLALPKNSKVSLYQGHEHQSEKKNTPSVSGEFNRIRAFLFLFPGKKVI